MSLLRLRIRGPTGQAMVVLEGSATIKDLKNAIKEKTSLSAFDVRAGYPPKLLPLDDVDPGTALQDFQPKLDGEQLTVSERETKQPPPVSDSGISNAMASANDTRSGQSAIQTKQNTSSGNEADRMLQLQRKANTFGSGSENDPPEILMPDHGGTLVLRVMPDDNSCLFRALGTALLDSSLDVMHELRSVVAQGIQADPALYSSAVLGKNPDDYCKWIQREDSWGGGIEIGIIAQAFGVEVASINVQDLRVDRFNEQTENGHRVVIVYSGIHYDLIAFSPDGCGPELDVKQFGLFDTVIEDKAVELCGKLQQSHYYTDTTNFDIKCSICGWMGKGEKGASLHAEQTGHMEFGEAR